MSRTPAAAKVAFILPTFPNLTGTFYMNEIVQVRRYMPVGILALAHGEDASDVSDALAGNVSYLDDGARSILRDHVAAVVRRPVGYVKALLLAMRGRRFGMLKRFVLLPHWARYVRENGSTIIHAHFADHATEAAMMLSLLSGIPYAFSAHAFDIFIAPHWMKKKTRDAKFVVTCTEYNRRYMLARHVAAEDGPVITQLHGLDTEKFAPKPRRTREGGEVLNILSIGRMVPKKGMAYLVRACRLLSDRGINYHLDLVGDGPLREDLETLVRQLGIEDRVSFPGALRHEQIIPLYQAAHCYALPCIVLPNGDRDGIPNTIAEAMCMALPVVSTLISGIPEVLTDGETGLAVREHDVEKLADAIERLYDDPGLCRRLGEAAHRVIVDVFDVRKNSLTLVRLFGGPLP